MDNNLYANNTTQGKTLLVLGATGFIGREVVNAAVAAGWQVKALARSTDGARAVQQAGATPIHGDAREPAGWIAQAADATALIDLLQPALPGRLTSAAVRAISGERTALTAGLLAALAGLPAEERPVLLAVSGADDLQPDATGTISHASPLRERPTGFARIGIPVRRLIEASGLEATFVYLGNLVYGPGKVFAEQYVKGLAAGKARVVGSGANRLPLTHVADAAGALVHLAGLPRKEIVGHAFVAMDGADTTQRALLDLTANAMGVKRPGSVPAWLARLVTGSVAVETVILDAHADPSALLATGFRFRYPTPHEGVRAALGVLTGSITGVAA